MRREKALALAFGEGCLSGAIAAAVTMAGLSLALDDLLATRHLRSTLVIFVMMMSPFLGAAIARMVLPTSGGVNVAWLGSACFAGLVIGLATVPWQLWSPERAALQNAMWVATVVTVSGCAAAVWSRWRASRRERWSDGALVQLEQKLNSPPGRILVVWTHRVWAGLNIAVFLAAAWWYWTALDDTNWLGLFALIFVVLLFPGGFLALFALAIVTQIFPSLVEGYPLAVTLLVLWAAAGAISYRFWFVEIPRAVRRRTHNKTAGPISGSGRVIPPA